MVAAWKNFKHEITFLKKNPIEFHFIAHFFHFQLRIEKAAQIRNLKL